MWILFSFYNFFIDILFPKSCFVCKKKDEAVCKNCLTNFSQSLNTSTPFTYSHFSYRDDNIKKIIQAIKYYHRKDLIKPLVEATTIKNLKLETENCILVPIPMHPFRKMIRGYNQAEEITKIYSKILDVPYSTNILYRSKLTSRQVKSKNRNERFKNQKGSFKIKNFTNNLGKTIILIDDVTTTGSTLNEARNIFLKNGFKNVRAITLAH